MQITYDSSHPADQWRCNVYVTTSSPATIAMLTVTGALMGKLYSQYQPQNLGIFMILGVLTCWVIHAVVMAVLVLIRAAKGRRICTTTLTPDGVIDEMPERTAYIPWTKVREISCIGGDIYFKTLVTAHYIPRSAFPSEAVANDFCQVARAVKAGDTSRLGRELLTPVEQRAPNTVWPPPPSNRPYGSQTELPMSDEYQQRDSPPQ
ncbi:MAG: hypothetical protein ACLQVD_01290 [Capsulimonadaceae bacterium]